MQSQTFGIFRVDCEKQTHGTTRQAKTAREAGTGETKGRENTHKYPETSELNTAEMTTPSDLPSTAFKNMLCGEIFLVRWTYRYLTVDRLPHQLYEMYLF